MNTQISFGQNQTKKNSFFVLKIVLPLDFLFFFYVVYLMKTGTFTSFFIVPLVFLSIISLTAIFLGLLGSFQFENGKGIFRSRLFGRTLFSVEPGHVKNMVMAEQENQRTRIKYKVIVLTTLNGESIDFLKQTNEETEKLFTEMKSIFGV
jgi:hypothetical protein